MRVETWDSGFIRGRRRDIHPLIADVHSYGAWWPGVSVRPSGPRRARLVVHPGGWLRRRHRLDVELVKDRKDLGVSLRVAGDVVGEIEFYYLDEPTGTVVHYLTRVEAPSARAARRFSRDHRAAIREGLHALKDRFEGDRVPGTDPDPELLADQQQAMAEFQAGVEAHARKMAEQAEAE